MHIYQFMVVVGRQGEQQLTDESGEVTSHLQGMFYRTVRMLEAGEPLVSGWLGLPKEASAAFVMGFLRRDFGAKPLLEQTDELIAIHLGRSNIQLFGQRLEQPEKLGRIGIGCACALRFGCRRTHG